jgi:hypothetical protein
MSMVLRNFADGILADPRMDGVYWGDRKVFLASIPGVDVHDPEWCQVLDELRWLGLLEFARADLSRQWVMASGAQRGSVTPSNTHLLPRDPLRSIQQRLTKSGTVASPPTEIS